MKMTKERAKHWEKNKQCKRISQPRMNFYPTHWIYFRCQIEFQSLYVLSPGKEFKNKKKNDIGWLVNLFFKLSFTNKCVFVWLKWLKSIHYWKHTHRIGISFFYRGSFEARRINSTYMAENAYPKYKNLCGESIHLFW